MEMIFRLIRTNGVEFILDMPWPDANGKQVVVPQPDGTSKPIAHKIGAIFFVPAVEIKAGTGLEEESQTTPAHYEVWSMPTSDCTPEQASETRCYRIFSHEVALAEELWDLAEARDVVQSRFGDAEEPAPPAPAPAQQPSQQVQSNNGAG